MADSELVHMTPPYRAFCVMCCVASRIVCSSVENIEKEDGRDLRCNIHNPLTRALWHHLKDVTSEFTICSRV